MLQPPTRDASRLRPESAAASTERGTRQRRCWRDSTDGRQPSRRRRSAPEQPAPDRPRPDTRPRARRRRRRAAISFFFEPSLRICAVFCVCINFNPVVVVVLSECLYDVPRKHRDSSRLSLPRISSVHLRTRVSSPQPSSNSPFADDRPPLRRLLAVNAALASGAAREPLETSTASVLSPLQQPLEVAGAQLPTQEIGRLPSTPAQVKAQAALESSWQAAAANEQSARGSQKEEEEPAEGPQIRKGQEREKENRAQDP